MHADGLIENECMVWVDLKKRKFELRVGIWGWTTYMHVYVDKEMKLCDHLAEWGQETRKEKVKLRQIENHGYKKIKII